MDERGKLVRDEYRTAYAARPSLEDCRQRLLWNGERAELHRILTHSTDFFV